MKQAILFTFVVSAFSGALFAQAPPPQQQFGRFQATYDDLKSAIGLTDDQIAKLRQLQQDKMAATQTYYSKMADKQKELNLLLESNSQDAARLGQIMLELQTMRKQPPPGAGDLHDRAVNILGTDQKSKLAKLEEAQKLRGAVDQATQLGLLESPQMAMPGTPRPVKAAAPAK